MSYVAGNLHLRAGAPGSLVYYFDAVADTMATVYTAGYFNNDDDNLNLVVDDLIFCQCGDGDFWVKVSEISSGSVTTQMISGDGPYNGIIGTASAALSFGITELGTGTASAFTLPTPYAGGKVTITQDGTLARTITTDAGGVTLNSVGNTIVTYTADVGEATQFLGISATRWVLIANSADAVLS